MKRNLTAPRIRFRATNPMQDHDKLPQDLRLWAIEAALPWSARSLRRIWDKALRETGSREAALARLSAAEAATLRKQAREVWSFSSKLG